MNKRISELMDDELDGDEMHQTLDALKSQDARQTWQIYHLIGDTLRQEPCLSTDFDNRFARRMAQEPTILAPMPRKYQPPGRRMLVLSAAASVAAVALVVGTVLRTEPVTPSESLIVKQATTQQPSLAAAASPTENVNSYLIAHQEFSPSITMQGVAPYVRAVSAVKQESKR